MATEPKNQRLPERYRQVLEVLAVAPQGRGVNALLTIGFKLETIADLIRGHGEPRLEDRGCSRSDRGRRLAGARRFDHAETVATSPQRSMSNGPGTPPQLLALASQVWGCSDMASRCPGSAWWTPEGPGLCLPCPP